MREMSGYEIAIISGFWLMVVVLLSLGVWWLAVGRRRA